VFAGAKTAGAKVHAGAGKESLSKVPDFYVIGQSAVGADAEVGKNRMTVIQPDNTRRFGLRAPPPLVNFIGIRRAPVMGVRQSYFKTPRGRLIATHKRQTFLRLKIIFVTLGFFCTNLSPVYKKKICRTTFSSEAGNKNARHGGQFNTPGLLTVLYCDGTIRYRWFGSRFPFF
jgi:hypothetical protein